MTIEVMREQFDSQVIKSCTLISGMQTQLINAFDLSKRSLKNRKISAGHFHMDDLLEIIRCDGIRVDNQTENEVNERVDENGSCVN